MFKRLSRWGSQWDSQYFDELGNKIFIRKKSFGNCITCYVDIRCELLDKKILFRYLVQLTSYVTRTCKIRQMYYFYEIN